MRNFFLYIILISLWNNVTLFSRDTEKPEIIINNLGCGLFNVVITDSGDGIYFLPDFRKSTLKNFSPPTVISNFIEGERNIKLEFNLEVRILNDSAFIEFTIYDGLNLSNGNIEYAKIQFLPNLLNTIPSSIFYPAAIAGKTYTHEISINNGNSELAIDSVKLMYGSEFRLNDTNSYPKVLTKYSNISLSLNFYSNDINRNHFDTILVYTSCQEIKLRTSVTAYTINPIITVSDYDFGYIQIGKTYQLSDMEGLNFITIKNSGQGLLTINDKKILSGKHFKLIVPNKDEDETNQINSGDSIKFQDIKLQSYSLGIITDTLIISSSAITGDSIAILNANVIPAGVYAIPKHFGDLLVTKSDTGQISIRNNSNKPLNILSVNILNDNFNEFEILYNESIPNNINQIPIKLFPEEQINDGSLQEIKLAVRYTAKTEFLRLVDLSIKYLNDKDTVLSGVVISGKGIKPKIFVQKEDFISKVPTGEIHPNTSNLRIKNNSGSTSLYIKNIEILDESIGKDAFILEKPLIQDTTLSINDEYLIPIKFNPMYEGKYLLKIKITSNSFNETSPGSFTDTTISISGEAYQRPIIIFSNLNTVTNKCDIGSLSVKVVNVTSTSLLIDDCFTSGINKNAFTVSKNYKGYLIAPFDTIDLTIDYLPNVTPDLYHSAILNIKIQDFIFKKEIFAKNYISSIIISIDTLSNAIPGMIINEKRTYSDKLTITIKADDLLNLVDNKISFTLKYPSDELIFLGKISTDKIENIERIEFFTNYLSGGITELITNINVLKGNNFENINIYPQFVLMLSNKNKLILDPEIILSNEKSDCLEKIYRAGIIEFNFCESTIGDILLNKYSFDLIDIAPNPLTGDFINVKFSTGFRTNVKIQLVSTNGESIYIFLDDIIDGDIYNLNFNIQDVPNGVYFILLTAGNYTESLKISIEK